MTRWNRILAAAAILATGSLLNQTRADDPVASPKVKEMQAWHATASGSTEDKLDRSIKPVSPKLQSLLDEQKTIAAANDVDLAHPSALAYGTFRKPFPSAVELAPLK
ncbi:MAG: hypothetical protein KGS61_18890 [Verrucomicrobia bacterium]|nr:hypothetical protein [Verrucomicrobiota bacterium]